MALDCPQPNAMIYFPSLINCSATNGPGLSGHGSGLLQDCTSTARILMGTILMQKGEEEGGVSDTGRVFAVYRWSMGLSMTLSHTGHCSEIAHTC